MKIQKESNASTELIKHQLNEFSDYVNKVVNYMGKVSFRVPFFSFPAFFLKFIFSLLMLLNMP